MGESELDAILLSPALERKVDYPIKRMEGLDEVTKKLQRSDATVQTKRTFYDAVLEEYFCLCDRSASDVRIVHDPQFESGILKIQEEHEALLNKDGGDRRGHRGYVINY